MDHPLFTITVRLTGERTVNSVRGQLEEKGVRVMETSSVYNKEVCYYIACDPTIIPSLDEIGKVKPLAYTKSCNSD